MTTSITDLPKDVLFHILNSVDDKDRLACSVVSRQFSQLLRAYWTFRLSEDCQYEFKAVSQPEEKKKAKMSRLLAKVPLFQKKQRTQYPNNPMWIYSQLHSVTRGNAAKDWLEEASKRDHNLSMEAIKKKQDIENVFNVFPVTPIVLEMVSIKNEAIALPYAASLCDEPERAEQVKALVESGVDVNTQGQYGYTALHYAAQKGDEDLVKFLLKNGANKDQKSQIEGDTPIQCAKEMGNEGVYKILTEFESTLTLDELDSIHEEACTFFEQKHYQAALNLLLLLATVEPTYNNHWMDSGKCLISLKRYDEAFEMIAAANRLNTNDPCPYYYGAYCLMELDNKEEAIEMLDLCIETSMQDRSFASLKEEAETLRRTLQEGKK